MKSVISVHFFAAASHCCRRRHAGAAVVFAAHLDGLAEVGQAQLGHAFFGDVQRFEPVAHLRGVDFRRAGQFLRLADRLADDQRRIHAARIDGRTDMLARPASLAGIDDVLLHVVIQRVIHADAVEGQRLVAVGRRTGGQHVNFAEPDHQMPMK